MINHAKSISSPDTLFCKDLKQNKQQYISANSYFSDNVVAERIKIALMNFRKTDARKILI